MDAEGRLAAALGQSAVPARDPAFTLGVIRAAETQRFKAEAALSILRGGGLAAVGALSLLMLAGWLASDLDGAQTGILSAGGLFVLVAAARLMTQSLAQARVR